MRPKIICHMVTSIDGKLHPSRFTGPAAGVDAGRLRKHYDEVSPSSAPGLDVRARDHAGDLEGEGAAVTEPGITSREPFVGDRRDRDLAISIDRTVRSIRAGSPARGPRRRRALETVSDTYLAGTGEDGVSYLFAGPTAGTSPRPWSAGRDVRRRDSCLKGARPSTGPS